MAGASFQPTRVVRRPRPPQFRSLQSLVLQSSVLQIQSCSLAALGGIGVGNSVERSSPASPVPIGGFGPGARIDPWVWGNCPQSSIHIPVRFPVSRVTHSGAVSGTLAGRGERGTAGAVLFFSACHDLPGTGGHLWVRGTRSRLKSMHHSSNRMYSLGAVAAIPY